MGLGIWRTWNCRTTRSMSMYARLPCAIHWGQRVHCSLVQCWTSLSGAISTQALSRCVPPTGLALPLLSSASERLPSQSETLFRSEEHTSELQSIMRISYAVFCLKQKNTQKNTQYTYLRFTHQNTR